MKKILLIICVPILLYMGMERENISLFVASRLGNMDYYIGKDDTIHNYNEAVFLIQNQRYGEAKSLLEPLLNNKNTKNPGDIYELYGDLVYESRGSTDDVALFYTRALEHTDLDRINIKLSLLKDPTLPQVSPSYTDIADKTLSGQTERENRREELSRDQNYEKILNLDGQSSLDPDRISEVFNILNTGSTIPRDW